MVNSLEKKTTQKFPVNVTENEVINKLSSENEHLKVYITYKYFKFILVGVSCMISKITVTSDALQDLVGSLERKFDETERKYEESSRLSEERMNQIIETESKIIDLKTNMQRFSYRFLFLQDFIKMYICCFPCFDMMPLLYDRLEEKLSDMETENQILRKQSLLSSSSQRMSGKFTPATAPVNTKCCLLSKVSGTLSCLLTIHSIYL